MGHQPRTKVGPSGSVHGVLVVDKPQKMTSHDVVSAARRAFGTRRVGHAGTLDPMATGVLVLLFGEATKLSSVLTTDIKTYEARVAFGTSTDSLDADGKILSRKSLEPGWLSPSALADALQSERGRRLQIPPVVSAIKVDGKRAYARARGGENLELDPRDVKVHDLTLLHQEDGHVDVSLRVSKGYYVRSFARDLGDTLGAPSHLSRLRRMESGPFDLDGAQPLPLSGKEHLISVAEAARNCLPVIQVNDEGTLRLEQGKRLRSVDLCAPFPASGSVLFAAYSGARLVALVEPSENSEFRVKRGINDPTMDSSGLQSEHERG